MCTGYEDGEDEDDEALEKEMQRVLMEYRGRYKRVFGESPPDKLPAYVLGNKIREELTRKGLRPYRL